jgi:predicted DNA-binding WGR domain protein
MPIYHAYLEKRRPEEGQARFYALHLTQTLFGPWCLIREWGRIGSPGRVVEEWFDTLEEARKALEQKQKEKLKRGYLPLNANPRRF